MDNDLIKLLEASGFTPKEAQVYLALLELSTGTVTEIAKITELKRAIIYVILEGLIKRGYVSELPNNKINTFQAVDPSFILNQLKITTRNFSEMLPMLRTLHNKGNQRPRITYHESKENIWKIYEAINLAPEALFISSYERIEKHFPGSIAKWIEDYKKKRILVKGKHLVANNKFDVATMKEFSGTGQNTRYLPEISHFNIDFSLYGNKLALTSLEENPFIVVVESEELASSFRSIFEIVWKSGKEIKQFP
jgi:sugar-specific transcriptional regulator TrmB